MQGCGRFQAVRRLSQRGLVEVWSARPAGQESGEPLLIKALVYDPIVEREQFEAECERFVESARTQRSLVEAGARTWARVHEISKSEDYAAFVLDRFGRSAQKLIASRAAFDDRLLRWLVGGVLGGLRELRSLADGRAWGRLRSSNVFVGGDRDLGEAPVVLSDLAPSATLTPADHADDAVQLGRLIYQAVVRRELGDRELLLSGIAHSPEWARLGPAGEFWRSWCDRLLAASGDSASGLLDDLARELGVGDGGEGARVASDAESSVAPVPGRAPAAEPTPGPSHDGAPPAEPGRARVQGRPAPPARRRKVMYVSAGVLLLLVGGGVVALSGILVERKPVPVEPDPTPPVDPRAELERRLRGWGPSLLPEGEARRWWDEVVTQAAGSLPRLEQLIGLEQDLRTAGERLRQAGDVSRAGMHFVDEVARLSPTGESLRAAASRAVALEWAERVGAWGSLLPEGAAREWWRESVERAKESDTGRARLEGLRPGLERAKQAFDKLPEELRGQAGSAFAADLRAAPVISVAVIESSASSAVESARGVDPQLAERLSRVERDVRALPPGAFRERLLGLIDAARREPNEQVVAEVELECAGVKPLADALSLVFEQWKPYVNAALPSFRDPARPSPEELSSAATAVREWFAVATGLQSDAGPILSALREGRRLDEPVRLSAGPRDLLAACQAFASAASGAPGAERAIREVGELLNEWSQVEAARTSDAAAELVARAADEGVPLASALASWRRAGELPGWPASADDLASERRALDVLRRRTGALSADRADTLRKELESSASSRWRRAWDAVASSADADRMRAVAAAGEGLGVAAGVTAAARYQAELAALRGALEAGGDDAAVKSVVDAFAAAVTSLALDPGVRPGVSDWVRALSVAATPPPPPRPAGPAWMERASIGADGVVRTSFGGVEFVFVPLGDGSYLGATEVSLAMANAMLGERPGAAAELRGVLGLAAGETAFDRGMRVWRWSNRFAEQAAERLTDGREVPAWISPKADAAFQNRAGLVWHAPDLPPQPMLPTVEDPLQRISPVAAIFLAGLIDCRLPTEAEWRKGLEYEPNAQGQANLRDQSWSTQLSHWDGGVASTATPVAFEDVFVPQDRRRELRPNRDVWPMNDGVLWVQAVSRAGGSRISGLIGNVAEFVTADEIPPARDMNSARESVRAAGQGKVKVVGGSALSPPAIQPREAHATTENATYADVGFRLAFTSIPAGPPPAPVIEKVRALMDRAPRVELPAP